MISVFCLAIGYGIAGKWTGAIIAVFIGPAWLLARKYPDTPLPFACLLASVGLAVTGSLIGCPPLLMILGSTISLAVWDILLLDSALANYSAFEPTRQYENKHLQSLTLALGCGLLVVVFGRLSNIQIPFIVLLLCVTFILFALDRVWSYIQKAGKP
jgi:hypothetical protein